MLQIKMTYCQPPTLVWLRDEHGKEVLSRAPKSATRPARAHEVETWWENLSQICAIHVRGSCCCNPSLKVWIKATGQFEEVTTISGAITRWI